MALGYFSMDLTTSSGCCGALCGSLGVDNIGKLEVCGFLTVMCARRLSGYWNKRDSTLPLRYYTIVESWVANFLSKKGLNFCLSKARMERSIAPNWPIMGISCPQACLNTSHNLQRFKHFPWVAQLVCSQKRRLRTSLHPGFWWYLFSWVGKYMESWNHNPLPYSNENPWISDHLTGTVGVHCDPRHQSKLN